MFTKKTPARPSPSALPPPRLAWTPRPTTPDTTNSGPSTTRIEETMSPWKDGSPGVSIRLIFRPCHSRCASDAEIVICRRCSSSSQSVTVEPCSIVPSRLTAPDWNSIASTSDVFPVPRWPVTATLRIFPDSTAAIRTSPPRSLGKIDSRDSSLGFGAGHDLCHDGRFCIGVLLHVFPGTRRELPLDPGVEGSILPVRAEPVAARSLEQAVLEPVRLADPEQIARGFQLGHVRRLVCRVYQLHREVDQRL